LSKETPMSADDNRDDRTFTSSGRTRRRFLKEAALATAAVSSTAMLTGASRASAQSVARNPSKHCENVTIPMQEVEGKVAFITGGSSGFGLGIARAFADAGMKVVLGYRTKEHLDTAMKLLANAVDRVHSIKVDVTDRPGMEAAASETLRVFGKIHVLVNNAGIATLGPLTSVSYDDWDWTIAVNLNGVFNGIHAFLPHMQAHGESGQIVTISSVGGLFARPGAGAYDASKFAVVGMMEALRADLAETNIGVSVCCPGLLRSNIWDSDRNRPRTGQNSGYNPDEKRKTDFKAVLENSEVSMEPLEAGRIVLRGMRNNDLYIITHPEYEQHFRVRYEALAASIPPDLHPSSKRLTAVRSSLADTIYVKERDRKLCIRRTRARTHAQ
jgi:NAD(P)-dependent dehydrogenase (short-subunit alcohol dehydrogenase family)